MVFLFPGDQMAVDVGNFITGVKRRKEDGSKIPKIIKKFILEEMRAKKSGFINPVIVTFQNGDLDDNVASDFNVSLTPKKNGGINVEASTTFGQVFKQSHGNEGPELKKIIAIRNRKTNKVKLVEVDTALLINSALIQSHETDTSVSDFKKDFRDLHKTFGGKKIVNRLDQREKVNVNSMLSGNDIKDTVADIKVEDFSLIESGKESITNLLPPCHRQSTVLTDVYVLKEILSETELDSLREEVNKLEENKPNIKEFSQFFFNCYTEAKKSKDDLHNRLAGILFAEALIAFVKIPSKKLLSKRVILCSFSSTIHEKLLNEFCVKTESSVTRPLTMRDKCLCYIIAVCLICCNYQINLKLLATATSIHLNRLSRLAQVVGATQMSKDEQIYTLKLPLPALPKSNSGRGRRK